MAHAKIFISIYGAEEEEAKAHTKQLEESKGFVRSLLAKRLRMRSVPHLHFFRDESLTEGIRISNLVSETIAKDEAKSKQRDEEQD